MNTKQNREKAKKLLKKVPGWGIAVAVVGVVLLVGGVGGIYYKKKTKEGSGEEETEVEGEPDTTEDA